MAKTGERLEERPMRADSSDYESFLRLYESAFPVEERIDPELLLAGVQIPACSLNAYYDEGVFCGFTYEIALDCAVYLLFLAVDDSARSRGYGSRILSQVKDRAGERPVVLDIEPLVDDAPNIEQRRRRLKFYERNGFFYNGYQLTEEGVTYAVLATDGFSDMETFKEEFVRLAPGFANFELTRV